MKTKEVNKLQKAQIQVKAGKLGRGGRSSLMKALDE